MFYSGPFLSPGKLLLHSVLQQGVLQLTYVWRNNRSFACSEFDICWFHSLASSSSIGRDSKQLLSVHLFHATNLCKLLLYSYLRLTYPNICNGSLRRSFSLASLFSFPTYLMKVMNNVYEFSHDIPTIVRTITNWRGHKWNFSVLFLASVASLILRGMSLLLPPS